MTGIEVLRTERLILRHLTEDDAPFILDLLNSPGFIENIGDRGVRDLDGASRYITEGQGASYQRYGYGLWLTLLKDTGEPIGICGLVKREGLEDADVGYALLERFWGRGYAQEAAAIAANSGLVQWSIITAGFALAIAAFGAALGQGKAVASAAEAIARNPGAAGEIRGSLILGLVLIESLVIYVLLISLILFFLKPFGG